MLHKLQYVIEYHGLFHVVTVIDRIDRMAPKIIQDILFCDEAADQYGNIGEWQEIVLVE